MKTTGLRQRRSAVRQNLKADDSLAATQSIPRRPVVRVGDNQLRVLVMLGSPTMSLVVPGKECRSLIANGLLQTHPDGGFACITAKGLRVLADEMDKGRVASALERIKADVEKRKAAVADRIAARRFGEP